jgi:hypothetical protein
MKRSKKGFGLAEVIISFTLMIILIGVLAMAIRFSQNLMLQAEALRDKTDEAAVAFAQDQDLLVSEETASLTFGDGLLEFTLPVKIQVRQIQLINTEILTFRVFTEP